MVVACFRRRLRVAFVIIIAFVILFLAIRYSNIEERTKHTLYTVHNLAVKSVKYYESKDNNNMKSRMNEKSEIEKTFVDMSQGDIGDSQSQEKEMSKKDITIRSDNNDLSPHNINKVIADLNTKDKMIDLTKTSVVENGVNMGSQLQDAPNDGNMTSLRALQEHHSKSQNFTAVVILTYMRSGSSLTGDIVQQHKDAFYVFEPLVGLQHIIEQKQSITYLNGTVRPYGSYDVAKVRMDTLLGWLRCDLSKIYKKSFETGFHKYGKKTRVFYSCVKYKQKSVQSCLQQLRQMCLESKYRIIKTIRTPMEQIETLFKQIPGSKVIHLVRDPRATVESQRHRSVCSLRLGGLLGCAKRLCTNIYIDTLTQKALVQTYPGSIHKVLYEDILKDPVPVSRDMYNFIGIDFIPKISDYVMKITQEGNVKGCVVCSEKWQVGHSRSATPDKHLTSWKVKLPSKLISNIDTVCRNVINIYRYQFYTHGRI